MSPGTIGALATIAGVIFGFGASYFLQRRDEARMGGAAERQLWGQLMAAQRILKASKGMATPAWTNPGLQIRMEAAQWDRLVARFRHPASWDRINRAAVSLKVLEAWAGAHEDQPDPERIDAVRRNVAAVLKELDQRETKWLAWRPWLKGKDGRTRGTTAWVRPVVAALVGISVFAALAYGAMSAVDDPLDAAVAERELREMAPDAKVINCPGDDSKDRWTCVVLRQDAPVAQVNSDRPDGDWPRQQLAVNVHGDSDKNLVYARVVDSLSTADVHGTLSKAPRPRPLRSWIGRVGKPDAPATEEMLSP